MKSTTRERLSWKTSRPPGRGFDVITVWSRDLLICEVCDHQDRSSGGVYASLNLLHSVVLRLRPALLGELP
jgi:hypothetical protein